MNPLADTPWANTQLIAIDAESTGPNPRGAHLVSWGRWAIDLATGDREGRTWLLDPGMPIPPQATQIHGITTAHAQEHGQLAAEAVDEIARDLIDLATQGAVVVAFNARFDLTLLRAECQRLELHHHIDALTSISPVADPYLLDRLISHRSRRLAVVAQHYQVPPGRPHHAADDALTAARILHRMLTNHDWMLTTPPEILHRRQATWHALAQIADRSLETAKPARDYTTHWPLLA